MNLTPLAPFKKVDQIHNRYKLPLALFGVVLISLALTITSVSIYTTSGASQIDLSRPGFEQERVEVRQNEPARTYDTTSPITQTSIDEFLTEYDKRASDLGQYGSFSGPALDDASLQLIEPTQ